MRRASLYAGAVLVGLTVLVALVSFVWTPYDPVRVEPTAVLQPPFGPHLLATASTRSMLARMLENLRGVYRERVRPADLEWVLRMRLALPGTGLPEVLELATALGDQGRWQEGARLLEERIPDASAVGAERLRNAARALRAHLN